MVSLPDKFLQRMEAIFTPAEFDKFLHSYECPPTKGMRMNTLKLVEVSFLQERFSLRPIPWCDSGYYCDATSRPGLHPYHQAGAYYLQDPSAMAVIEALQVAPGDKVLDLCAAPGGKSTQIAAKLQNKGLLVANEVVFGRAKILRENLQRMGAICAVVLSNLPSQLAEKFGRFFDKVVVDAPCSGEGLFRKNPEAVEQWSLQKVNGCAKRQRDILAEAAKMVAFGGSLVYSTCTFAPQENEQQIEDFLQNHPEFSHLSVSHLPCFGEFSSYQIYPHLHSGEGHFLAVLQKTGVQKPLKKSKVKKRKRAIKSSAWQDFADKILRKNLTGELYMLNDNLYLVDFELDFPFDGLNALSVGLHLGKESKGRFLPSHALALALRSSDVCSCLDLACEGNQLADYLAGESLRVNLPSGWCLVAVDGLGVGWGKVAGGRLNNYLPKGLWRR